MAGRPPLRIGAHGKITRTHLGAFRSGRVSGDDLAEYYVSTLAASANLITNFVKYGIGIPDPTQPGNLVQVRASDEEFERLEAKFRDASSAGNRGGVTSMLRPHRMCWRRRSGCRWRNWRSGPKTDGPLGPGRLHPPVQFRRWGPPSRSPRPRG